MVESMPYFAKPENGKKVSDVSNKVE